MTAHAAYAWTNSETHGRRLARTPPIHLAFVSKYIVTRNANFCDRIRLRPFFFTPFFILTFGENFSVTDDCDIVIHAHYIGMCAQMVTGEVLGVHKITRFLTVPQNLCYSCNRQHPNGSDFLGGAVNRCFLTDSILLGEEWGMEQGWGYG